MKLSNNRTIADCWLPTFENVAREFIIENLKNILSSDKTPNFKFDFREEEAIEFIEDIIKRYIDTFNGYDFKASI